jgi:hypothetical protein
MAEAPHHEIRETKTLQFARLVVRNRFLVAIGLILSTLFFFYPIFNTVMTALGERLPGPIVRVNTNARDLFPDHPYIHAQDKFSKMFGGSSLVAIAVSVDEGNIFTPETLRVIAEVTQRLDGIGFNSQRDAREDMRDLLEENESLSVQDIRDRLDAKYPPYPVNHNQINSIAHRSARVVQIEASGDITTTVLMEKIPETQEEAEAIRAVVLQNPPIIYGRLVSKDEKGALITAGFVTDRLANRETYMSVFNHVQLIKADIESEHENITIHVSGFPILTGWILKHAFEILVYVMGTITAIFLLLWLYFRRWHGVDEHHVRPADPRDSHDHHRPRRVSHGADGGALLRRLRDHAATLRRSQRGQGRGGDGRHGRADRPGHPGHHHRRCGPARDHGDLDPPDAEPGHLRGILGGVDHRNGGDPPPGPDLLPARPH